MCNITFHDDLNRVWALAITLDGAISTTFVTNLHNANPNPILLSNGNYWLISPGEDGNLHADTVAPSISAVTEIGLRDLSGNPYQLGVTDAGELKVSPGGIAPIDDLPSLPDVKMHQIPAPGLVCYSEGNAPGAIRSDYAIWCCTTQRFVTPENSNMVVFIDE